MALKTTLHVMDTEKFQCSKCLNLYQGRVGGKERLKKLRKFQGCFGNTRRDGYTFDGIEYRTCPGNLFSSSAIFVIELYRQYQKGFLPYGGTMVDQPAKLMDAFAIIDAYNNQKLAEMQAKQAEMMKRGKRGRV